MLRTGMWLFNAALVMAVFFPVPQWLPWGVGGLLLAGRPWHACWRCRRVLWLLPVLAGLGVGSAQVTRALALRLLPPVEAPPVQVSGRIEDLVDVQTLQDVHAHLPQRVYSFVLLTDAQQEDAGAPASRRLRVRAWTDQDWPLQAGDRIGLRVRVLPPRGLVNDAGPDTERAALAQHMHGFARVDALLWHVAGESGVGRLRERVSAAIRARLAEAGPGAALVPALVTGDRRQLDGAHWRVFQVTGIAHLVAISGLHISLVAGLAWWLLARALALPLAWLPGAHIASRWALLPASAVAVGYAALAGFTLPTQRALVMTLVLFLVHALRWRLPVSDYLLLALTAVLLADPLAVLGAGFWLSFLAVALLALVMTAGDRGLLRTQVLLSLGTGAVAGWLFAGWSLLSVPVNLLLVPLFSFVIIPLSLAGVWLPASWQVLEGCGWLLDRLWPLLVWLSGWPLLAPPMTLTVALLGLLACVLLVLPALPRPRWLLPLCCLPYFFPPLGALQDGQFEVVNFDVGQGQMTLVRTRHHALLYDTGPRWHEGSAVSAILHPWLAARRVSLSLAFVSHGDDDHDGGVADVRALWPSLPLFSGEPVRLGAGLPCWRGQRWLFDGVRVEVLWPGVEIPLRHSNNRSCVLRISSASGSVLLTGDIEQPVEFWLAQQHVEPVSLLQVPHHGSRTSSSFALLRALSPELAMVSAGYDNRFGHPASSVRKRYADFAIPLFNTSDTGMQSFRFLAPGQVQVERLRDRARWPWRLPEPVVE